MKKLAKVEVILQERRRSGRPKKILDLRKLDSIEVVQPESPEQAIARAKGKQLGRPKKMLDTKGIAALRGKGIGWKRIAAEMGVGVGTIYRIALEGSKTREKVF